MMSTPSARWISTTRSGVSSWVAPSIGERNVTPSSVSRRSLASEKTWKPPESVRIGPSQPMKRWSPPSSRTRSGPGRTSKWYVLLSTIWAPAARRSSGLRLFTAARVPTGMKAGVSTTPCAVTRRPRRAAPSLATTSNASALTTGATGAGSYDQRRVAIGVEPVAGRERMTVGAQDRLAAGEGGHQHQQRGARQVEIRQQRVDDAEAMARPDVDRRVAVEDVEPPVLTRRALQRARHRGADGDHPPALGARRVDGGGGGGRHHRPLGRQRVALDRRRLDGPERRRPHVQRERVDLRPRRAQPLQQ